MDIADGAPGLVATRNDPDTGPGGRVSQAFQLLELAERALVSAVIYERKRGSSWTEILSEEYEKLRRYDADTPDQPLRQFQCHQSDAGGDSRRTCAGWAGCHNAEHLLGLRLAVLDGRIDTTTYQAAVNYQSPVPLFTSGGEAADHGQKGIDAPVNEDRRKIHKITQTRQDLQ
ncbi:DUF6283 family protein [Streptomyces lavendulocolor]|uniref:DUF6283 family protein n=1 Tax=Streptomyces lavendulocolor TaxID=67316 RepID=UPI003C2C5002